MQILQVSQSYLPNVGGVEKHLQQVNRYLLKAGHQVTVLTGGRQETGQDQAVIEQIPVFYLDNQPQANYKWHIWKQILQHQQLFHQADIIQMHDVFWWALPLYPFIKSRVFTTFHGYEGSQAPDKKAIRAHQLAWRLSRGSLAIGGWHHKYYGITPDVISFGASDLQLNQHSTKRRQSAKKIIFIGRLAPDTGILEYLKALKLLKKQQHNYSLDVYGDGPLLDQATKYAQKQRLAVTFHGFQADADRLLVNYPIAFVSQYLAIAETLKSGCQVIAYYNNQLKQDYLKMSPFPKYITMVHDAQEISQQLESGSRQASLDQALAKRLTWSTVTKQYLRLWQKN